MGVHRHNRTKIPLQGSSVGTQYLSKTAQKLKELNRIACMSLTPTTRSKPQAALEIMYKITPLDLHLTETGLKTYLRLKSQLDQPKHTGLGLGLGLGLGVYFDIPTSYTNTTFSWLIQQQGESWKGEPRTCGHYPPSIWGVYNLYCKV